MAEDNCDTAPVDDSYVGNAAGQQSVNITCVLRMYTQLEREDNVEHLLLSCGKGERTRKLRNKGRKKGPIECKKHERNN